MVKCGGLRFQFCPNAAIYPLFLVRVGFNSHSGYNISNALPYKLEYKEFFNFIENLSGASVISDPSHHGPL